MSKKSTTVRVPIAVLPKVRQIVLEHRQQELAQTGQEIKEELDKIQVQIQSEPQPV